MTERFARVTCGREDVCPLISTCLEIGAIGVKVNPGVRFSRAVDIENTSSPLKNCQLGLKRWRSTSAEVDPEIVKMGINRVNG